MAVSPDLYRAARSKLFELGYGDEWHWSETVPGPENARDFAHDAIWVVCCSGFKEQAARVTERAVRAMLDAGRSAVEVFPTSRKGPAIDRLWADREACFAEFQRFRRAEASPEAVIAWIATLPYVGGKILRYHFAKNLGVDCAKPDRWLCRLAGIPEDTPVERAFQAAMDLCRPIADLRQGFAECFRVLSPDGVLVFKWNETQVKVRDVLALTPVQPLFGHTSGRRGLTHWYVFMKPAAPGQCPG
jgi:hypothetical protein